MTTATSGTRWFTKPDGTRWFSQAADGTRWFSQAADGTRWFSKPDGTRWFSQAAGTRWFSTASAWASADLDVPTRTTIADAMSRAGMTTDATGRGVTVAIVDTGVADTPALAGANIVVGPDFSTEPWYRGRDTNGHGTHLAGIITSMAPEARLLSLRAGETDGQTHPAAVAAAVNWLVDEAPRHGLGAHVLVLAYTVDASAPEARLVEEAVARAWDAGITVVTASGNAGGHGLPAPATVPSVIAVGAEGGTDELELADFSTQGDLARRVDVLAPGRSIVSARAIGAKADEDNERGRVGETLVAATGTSQAAAIVAAACARLIESTGMDNYGVKQALVATARPVPGSEAGLIDLAMAEAVSDTEIPSLAALTEFDLRDAGRFATRWAGATWAGATWAGATWAGATWAGATWAGATWAGATWAGATWAGATWAGATWAGATWAGATWAGATWAGATWAGATWAGATWAGATWAGATWAGATWAGATWAGATWAGATWAGATWAGATWAGATWAGATWAGATWAGATWAGATWAGATWAGATWAGATWAGATWAGATWAGTRWF